MIPRHYWLVLILALCGCQAGHTPMKDPNAGLPVGLPSVSGSPGITTPARTTSAEVVATIHGDTAWAHSPGCTTGGGNSMLFWETTGVPAWAIYEVPNIAADYRPVSVSLEFVETDNPYWVALANYQDKRWEYVEGPFTGDGSFSFDAGWEDYASGSNSLFFAIVEVDSACTFSLARVTLDDTRPLPAPTGLTGTPLSNSALLEWDAYPDGRADTIRIMQGSSTAMSDATEVGMISATAISYTVGGLTNGETSYFGVKAVWDDEPLESGLSNIVEVTPEATGPITLSGLWPRRGNRADNRGCTTNLGPPTLDDFASVVLCAEAGHTNRTTPVIGLDGRVYALGGDCVLHCYSSDLSTEHWSFSAADHGGAGDEYFSLPHSPILDSDGNSYFVAAPVAENSATPYLYCVDSTGGQAWRYELTGLPDNLDYPYPSPTITADGWIVVCDNGLSRLTAVNPADQSAEWTFTAGGGEIHGDFSLSAANHLEVPVWHTGVGIPESLWHWVSVDAATGDAVASWRDMGSPENIYGGLSLTGDLFAYPEGGNLILLDALTASRHDPIEYPSGTAAPPARNSAGTLLYQLLPPFGITGFSNLNFVTFDSATPELTELAGISLHGSSVSSQPAVAGDGGVFFPTEDGTLYRVDFDPEQPVGEGNPVVTDTAIYMWGDSYMYNSFAIGDGAVYIITEVNMLYCIYDALD